MNEQIYLSDENYLASGGRRDCYYHPENENQCIKISKNKDGIKDSSKEVSYMGSVKNRINFDKYSAFLYTVATNRGLGHVFELIRDHPSGQVSTTLDKVYLDSLFLGKGPETEELDKKIHELVSSLQSNKILVADFKANNIAVQFLNENDFELKIIDGMGRSNSIPLLDRLGWVSRKQINKYYQRKLGLIILSYKEAHEHFIKHSN